MLTRYSLTIIYLQGADYLEGTTWVSEYFKKDVRLGVPVMTICPVEQFRRKGYFFTETAYRNASFAQMEVLEELTGLELARKNFKFKETKSAVSLA